MTHQNQRLEWAERLKVGLHFLHGVWRMALDRALGWGRGGGWGGGVNELQVICDATGRL